MMRSFLMGALFITAVFLFPLNAAANHATQNRCISMEEITSDIKNGPLSYMYNLHDGNPIWKLTEKLKGNAARNYAVEHDSPHADWQWDTLARYDSTSRWYAFVMFHNGCYVAHAVRTRGMDA